MKWARKYFLVRISFYFLTMVMVFGALMSYYINRNNQRRYRHERELLCRHGEEVARSLSSNVNVVLGLRRWDTTGIERTVVKECETAEVAYTVIYNEYNKPAYAHFEGGREADFALPPLPTSDPGKVLRQDLSSRRGERYLDFLTPINVTEKSLLPVGAEKARIGWLRVGLSLSPLEQELRRVRQEGVGLIFLVVMMGGGLIGVLARSVFPPLRGLTRGVRRLAAGELGYQVEVHSEDEFGLLGRGFNEMSTHLLQQARRQEEMIRNIREAIGVLTSATSDLMAVSTQQAAGASRQAAAVEEMATTAEEISATAKKIAESAVLVNEVAEATSQACHQGQQLMEESLHEMTAGRREVETATSQVQEASRQAQLLTGVIGIIEEITEQTDLLALNAEIEAAGAEAAGLRFGVVARELRKLANRALDSSRSVREIVVRLLAAMQSMTVAAEQGQKAVERGVSSVNKMGNHFQLILDKVAKTQNAAAGIRLTTNQQASASQQMVSAFGEVANIAKEVESGVHQIEAAMGELTAMTQQLQELIAKIN